MKIVKYVLLPIMVVIGIYALLCVIGPKDFDTSESIDIKAPPSVVYNLVNSLQKSAEWNEWTLNDTAMVTTYNDIPRGVGAESSWTSESSGNGTQKIIEVQKDRYVKSAMEFEDWEGINHAEFIIAPDGKNSDVTWTFKGGSPVPFLFRGIMLVTGAKGEMEENYENGLKNIKRIAEERAQKNLYNGYTITEQGMEEKNFVMTRQVVKMANAQQFYSTSLGALFNKVQEAGIEMDGVPCGLYFKWDEGASETDMAAAIPVDSPIAIEGASAYQIRERNAIVVDHYGSQEESITAHFAIDEYMLDKGYLFDPPVVEEYVQSEDGDPAKSLTKIIYYYSE